jgi:hypothetical protein
MDDTKTRSGLLVTVANTRKRFYILAIIRRRTNICAIRETSHLDSADSYRMNFRLIASAKSAA